MNDRSPRDLALRALRDCRVIRASNQHPAFMGLFADFMAEASAVRGRPGMLDYRLSDRGRFLASRLKPWNETR